MKQKFFIDSENRHAIWQNFWRSFDHITLIQSVSLADEELAKHNGKYYYTPYHSTAWIEFKSIEDLTQFILRFS
jgi:hypothetical protein